MFIHQLSSGCASVFINSLHFWFRHNSVFADVASSVRRTAQNIYVHIFCWCNPGLGGWNEQIHSPYNGWRNTLDHKKYGLSSWRRGNYYLRWNFFVNHSTGWIATNDFASNTANPVATVVYTVDSGKSWTLRPIQEPFVASIRFINETEGWAAGSGGILHTTDGGVKWTEQIEISSDLFVALCFIDQQPGWGISYEGAIYRYQ